MAGSRDDEFCMGSVCLCRGGAHAGTIVCTYICPSATEVRTFVLARLKFLLGKGERKSGQPIRRPKPDKSRTSPSGRCRRRNADVRTSFGCASTTYVVRYSRGRLSWGRGTNTRVLYVCHTLRSTHHTPQTTNHPSACPTDTDRSP